MPQNDPGDVHQKSSYKLGLILFICGISIIGCGLFYSKPFLEIRREVFDARNATPLSMEIDLSTPGAYTAPCIIATAIPPQQSILLKSPLPVNKTNWCSDVLLEGIDAEWVLTDAEGEPVCSGAWQTNHIYSGAPSPDYYLGGIPVFNFQPGEYTFTVTVAAGAPKLQGTRQKLYTRNRFNGIEGLLIIEKAMPMLACFAGGGVVLLVGCVLLVVVSRKRSRV